MKNFCTRIFAGVLYKAASSNCVLADFSHIQDGFSWTTIDCRQCICENVNIDILKLLYSVKIL